MKLSASAVAELHDQLQQATAQLTPCAASPGLWFSDDHATQAAAACLGCHALMLCDLYALAAEERHGVWGGIDRSDDNRKARRR